MLQCWITQLGQKEGRKRDRQLGGSSRHPLCKEGCLLKPPKLGLSFSVPSITKGMHPYIPPPLSLRRFELEVSSMLSVQLSALNTVTTQPSSCFSVTYVSQPETPYETRL